MDENEPKRIFQSIKYVDVKTNKMFVTSGPDIAVKKWLKNERLKSVKNTKIQDQSPKCSAGISKNILYLIFLPFN